MSISTVIGCVLMILGSAGVSYIISVVEAFRDLLAFYMPEEICQQKD